MKNHVNALIVAGVIITSTGCTAQTGITENDLIGNWIEIMPVNVQFTQGVTLQKEGVASSIGMATLKYESWELKDGKSLILNGQSIGNRQTISFSDTLSVISLQNDTLTLGKGDKYRIQYTRQTDAPQPIGGSDAAMGYTYSDVEKENQNLRRRHSRTFHYRPGSHTGRIYRIWPGFGRSRTVPAGKQGSAPETAKTQWNQSMEHGR